MIKSCRGQSDTSHFEKNEKDDLPVLGFYSKTLGIPPTRARLGRAHNVHSMLINFREDSKALSELERTATRVPSGDAIYFDETIQAAKLFALKERNRNMPKEAQETDEFELELNKTVTFSDDLSVTNGRGFIREHLDLIFHQQDKENIPLERTRNEQLIRSCNRLFKLSTQGDLRCGVDKSVPTSYRHLQHGVAVKDWIQPSHQHVPFRPKRAPGPGRKKQLAVEPTMPPTQPNNTYWTGDSDQDDNTLLILLSKFIRSPNKTKKKVRFTLPGEEVQRKKSNQEEGLTCSPTSAANQQLHKERLQPQLKKSNLKHSAKNNDEAVNSVHCFNYFSQVWTLLEDIFGDEARLWMNSVPSRGLTSATSTYIQHTHTHRAHVSSDDCRLELLLTRGLEDAENLFNISRLCTPQSPVSHACRGVCEQYAAAKAELLAQVRHVAEFKFSADPASCFSSQYGRHWSFLSCLLVDVILRKRVFRSEYAELEAEDGAEWESLRPQVSRVALWESGFERVVSEVLGGAAAAGRMLSLRQFMLLRQFFDEQGE